MSNMPPFNLFKYKENKTMQIRNINILKYFLSIKQAFTFIISVRKLFWDITISSTHGYSAWRKRLENFTGSDYTRYSTENRRLNPKN